jgi:YihY family inner membrane protein
VFLLESVDFLLSFGAITLLLAMIFKFLPDTEIAWSDVWIGAAVASLLFTIGKALIGLYLVRSTVASAYGAAASLVILLVWIYYSAQLLLLGAEVTTSTPTNRARDSAQSLAQRVRVDGTRSCLLVTSPRSNTNGK